MNPTPEQVEFKHAVKDGINFVGQARAGTGKTSTAIYSAKENPRRRIVMVAFNVKNAKDISENPKCPSNLAGSTFHSLALKELTRRGRVEIVAGRNGNKNQDIIKEHHEFTKASGRPYSELSSNVYTADKLMSLSKNTMVKPTPIGVVNLMNEYDLYPEGDFDKFEFAQLIVDFVQESDNQTRKVDYDDMIRFCVINDYAKNIVQDLFLVDEAQDNTPIRTEFMVQVAENSAVAGIGDDRQAIYAFAGADNESIFKIIERLKAKVLPLSINFRCDKSIIREAQKIVPDIQFFEEKEEGSVQMISDEMLVKLMQPGDVAIGRYNRIILSKCFKFIKDGKPATIQGADFGKMLKAQIAALGASDVEDFYVRLDAWLAKQTKFSADAKPSEAIADRYDCLKYLADNCSSIAEINKRIDSIFKDSCSKSQYTFSTAHRSKGMEWDRVFCLDWNNFCNRNPMLPPSQAKQEMNLKYIAITRARHELYLVS